MSLEIYRWAMNWLSLSREKSFEIVVLSWIGGHGVIYVDSIGEVFEKRFELRQRFGEAAPAVRLRSPIVRSEPGQGSDE